MDGDKQKLRKKYILTLFKRARSGLFSVQVCVSKNLGQVIKVKAKRELVRFRTVRNQYLIMMRFSTCAKGLS